MKKYYSLLGYSSLNFLYQRNDVYEVFSILDQLIVKEILFPLLIIQNNYINLIVHDYYYRCHYLFSLAFKYKDNKWIMPDKKIRFVDINKLIEKVI